MNCRRPVLAAIAVLAFLFAACAERPVAESPEVRFEREVAYRQACVANLLAQRAVDDLRVVEMALTADTASDPVSQLSRRAAEAAFNFARAYQRHAELRATAYASLDSAVNHAQTSADSARLIQRAASITISAPDPGTVEANVIERYQQDLTAMLADQNHPCNWNFPF